MKTETAIRTENLPDTTKFRPKYIPIEKILELREKNLTHESIAKLLGCTVSAIRKRLANCINIVNHTESFKSNRADVIAFHQQKIMSKLAESEIKAPRTARDLKDAVTAFGILYDKERLERGQSTENIAFADVSEKIKKIRQEREELTKRIVELES